MTVTRGDQHAHPGQSVVDPGWPTSDHAPRPELEPARSGVSGERGIVATVRGICPYLASDSGAWRSARPTREHRCLAVLPWAPLAASKQRSVCLLPAHLDCSTYLAAREVAAASVGDGRRGTAQDPGPWGSMPTLPVVLDTGRGGLGALAAPSQRTSIQLLLVGLMTVAFVFLLVSRTSAPPGGAGGDVPSAPVPSLPAVAGASSPLTPAPSATAAATGTPSAAPTSGPTPTSTPSPPAVASPAERYRVRPGDTLSAIAARFGTTVRELAAANEIDDPSLIRVGQVLVIP